MKKISIIVATYNESKNIKALHDRVSTVMQTLPNYNYELIFIDNASTDDSRKIFEHVTATDARVAVLCMSRNFGSNQPSLLAGMQYATGDCTIAIDGDLQDPPELISAFVKKWEEGYDVVYGVRMRRKGSILRRIGYAGFYRVFRMLSYLEIPLDAGDTCLIDRKVINIITSLPEKDLYIRGLRTWAGFRQIGLNYVREDRAEGISSNSFLANFSWAKKAIVNFSYKPLEFISRLAVIAVGVTCCAAGIYLYWHFKYGAPRGFSTLLMVMFIFGTIQLLALSVIGEYLIRIFQEVKARPTFIVQEILQQQKKVQEPFLPAQITSQPTGGVCNTCKNATAHPD